MAQAAFIVNLKSLHSNESYFSAQEQSAPLISYELSVTKFQLQPVDPNHGVPSSC